MPSSLNIIATTVALGGGVAEPGIERCGFERIARDHGSEVRAFVFGTPDTLGVYRLAIEVVSKDGRSSVEQGGMFRIPDGADRAMVGMLGTRASSETQLHISLSASAGGRDVACAVLISEDGAIAP